MARIVDEARRQGVPEDAIRVVTDSVMGEASIVYVDPYVHPSPTMRPGAWLVVAEGALDIGDLRALDVDDEGEASLFDVELSGDPHAAPARLDSGESTRAIVRASSSGLSAVRVSSCSGPAVLEPAACGDLVARCPPDFRPFAIARGDLVLGADDACLQALDALDLALLESVAAKQRALRESVQIAPERADATRCRRAPAGTVQAVRAKVRASFLRETVRPAADLAAAERRQMLAEAAERFDAETRSLGGAGAPCADPSGAFLLSVYDEDSYNQPSEVVYRVRGRVLEPYVTFDLGRVRDRTYELDLTGDGAPEQVVLTHVHESPACSWLVLSPSWSEPVELVAQCRDYGGRADHPEVLPIVTAGGGALVHEEELLAWTGSAFAPAQGLEPVREHLLAIGAARSAATRARAVIRSYDAARDRADWAEDVARALAAAGVDGAIALQLAERASLM